MLVHCGPPNNDFCSFFRWHKFYLVACLFCVPRLTMTAVFVVVVVLVVVIQCNFVVGFLKRGRWAVLASTAVMASAAVLASALVRRIASDKFRG